MSLIRNFNLLKVLFDAFIDVSPQYPLPVDSDSIYAKDVWVAESDTTGWVDTSSTSLDVVLIPFTNLNTVIEYSGATNPKVLLVHFNREVSASQLSIGTSAGDFSNVKLELLGSGGVVRETVDLSADATKLTSLRIPFEPQVFTSFRLSFLTADTVSLSNIAIQKTITTATQIQGIKPDGTLSTINSTQNGNLKFSLEELDSTLSVNSNTQLKTTPHDSSGNEYGIDPVSNAQIIVNEVHHKTHDGNAYRVCNIDTALTNGSNIDLLFITGSVHTHIQYYANVGGNATIFLYEDTTFTGGTGTLQTLFNKNRNSLNTSSNAVRLNPTVTGVGTLLQPMLAPGGSGGITNGGSISERWEWVLKPNTNYLLRLTNIAGTTQPFHLASEWYEVAV